MLHDAALYSQSPESVRSVFAPKTEGMSVLMQATSALALQNFTSFSSVAAFIGSPGQASYAAANASLTELSRSLTESGQPGRTNDLFPGML